MKKIVIVFIVSIAVIACKKNNKILSFSERTSEIRTNFKKVVKGTDTTYFYDPALLIGAKIPIFEIASLDSTIFNNNSIYGKKAILHFWYRTCPNCMTELPGLIKFYDEFRNQNIEVLSLKFELLDSPTLATSSFRLFRLSGHLTQQFHMRVCQSCQQSLELPLLSQTTLCVVHIMMEEFHQSYRL